MKRNKLVYNFGNTLNSSPQHSMFVRNSKLITAFNAGDLVPIYLDEILPGDNVKLDIKALIRQTTMLKPVMDVANIDVYGFFVPNRIIWDDFKKFFGENEDPWAVSGEILVPTVSSPTDGWKIGTIADYMGLPINKKGLKVSALPFRAYAQIVNDWFRDQNLQSVAHINKTNSAGAGSNGTDWVKDLELGGKPFIANKYHDYFTSALPKPQKGNAINLNIGGSAPIYTSKEQIIRGKQEGLLFSNTKGTDFDDQKSAAGGLGMVGINVNGKYPYSIAGLDLAKAPAIAPKDELYPNNLYADLSKATGISINDLRQAITYQHMLEKDARSGTRYVEYLRSHFGVNSPDATQQRAEYLGGYRKPLNVNTVPQTSNTVSDSAQASLAAFGESFLNESLINKTFLEHGYLILVASVRYEHSYQQGLEQLWTRSTRNDFYDPIFANIGEQPIKNKEIYFSGGTTTVDDEIFGYNEAWASYRTKFNKITGMMRSIEKGLDYYHYGDNYNALPKLSAEWLREDKTNIDRTLAVKSTDDMPQFQADFYFEVKHERPMPVFSIPGIDRI